MCTSPNQIYIPHQPGSVQFCDHELLFDFLSDELNRYTASYVNFKQIRTTSEQLCRNRSSRNNSDKEEITLQEIYEKIEADYHFDHEMLTHLMEKEIELEEHFCTKRAIGKELYELAMEAGKKILICSDMYLPQQTIETKIINSERLSFSDLHDSITTKHIFSSLCLYQPPQAFEKRIRLVRRTQEMLSEPIQLPLEIKTGSNVDYTELQNICKRYAVNSEQLEKYRASLNKFLNYRNRIAHGDNSITVDPEHIVEFSQTVVSLMSDIAEILTVHVTEKNIYQSHMNVTS